LKEKDIQIFCQCSKNF